MPADFQFLRPEWLWAIPAVIATAILLARRQLGPGSWQHVVDPALAPHVLSGSPRRKSDLRWWLLGVAGVMVSVLLLPSLALRLTVPVYPVLGDPSPFMARTVILNCGEFKVPPI